MHVCVQAVRAYLRGARVLISAALLLAWCLTAGCQSARRGGQSYDAVLLNCNYYPNGATMMVCEHKFIGPHDLVQSGVFIAYYPSGFLAVLGQFEGGWPTGTWQIWHPNGTLYARADWRRSARDLGYRISLNDSLRGSLSINALPELASCGYQIASPKGDPISPDDMSTDLFANYSKWYDDGKPACRRSLSLLQEWDTHGQLITQVKLDDDLPHGNAFSWYSNGRKHYEGTFCRGERDGLWTWWREDGSPEKVGQYVNGALFGTWTFWDTGGHIRRQEVFMLPGRCQLAFEYENGVVRQTRP